VSDKHPVPAHDSHPTPDDFETPTRRTLLFKAGVGFNVVAGALLAIPIVGYVFSTFAHKKLAPEKWISLGDVNKYPAGQTRLAAYKNPFTRPWDGPTADIPCWVRRIDEQKFQVFAINCTHLGCPVRWFQESKLFMCPCHGGAYYEDGGRAAGPPPRGLFEYAVKVDNNQLFIRGGILPTLAEPLSQG
jgi:menaquinol-cytochrome c reductase iron-sulfur subunit